MDHRRPAGGSEWRRIDRPLPALMAVTLSFAVPLLLVPSGSARPLIWVASAVGLWSVVLCAMRRRRCDRWIDPLLLTLLLTLGAGWGSCKQRAVPPPRGLPETTVRGRVDSAGKGIADLSVASSGEWLALTGRYLPSGGPLPAGEFVGRGYIFPFDEPRLPGFADRWRGARWGGSSGFVRIVDGWESNDAEQGHSLAGWRGSILRSLTERVGRSVDPRIAPLIPQIVWGELFDTDPELQRWFRVTGTMHLLAISGLHVSLIALLVEFAVRVAVPRRGPRLVLVLAGLCFYMFLVGARPSVLRSIVMAAAILVARTLGRPDSSATAWWGSLLLVAVLTPGELTGPGAQLSFLATAALILRPPVPQRLGTVTASYCATVATSGVLFAHFGETAPLAVIVNLVAIPAFTPCLVSMLWGLAWGDPASPWLQSIAWGPARLFIDLWLGCVSLFVPVGERTLIRVSSGEVAGFLSSLLFLAACFMARRIGRKEATVPLILAAGVVSIMLAAIPSAVRARWSRCPEIVMLPIGQGDSILIRPSRGKSFLIDTGPDAPDGSRGRRLAGTLRSLGISRLQGMFLTHGDFDHCGALGGLLSGGIEVDTLWVSEGDDYSLRVPRRRAPPVVSLAAPHTWNVPPLQIDLLWPRRDLPAPDGNEASLVLRIAGPGGTVLLPGDLGGHAEVALLAAGGIGQTDILAAGHHGSRGSTTEAWIEAISPRQALISCGARNRFGHPHAELLERFHKRGIPVLRTDLDGPIRVAWTEKGMEVRAGG